MYEDACNPSIRSLCISWVATAFFAHGFPMEKRLKRRKCRSSSSVSGANRRRGIGFIRNYLSEVRAFLARPLASKDPSPIFLSLSPLLFFRCLFPSLLHAFPTGNPHSDSNESFFVDGASCNKRLRVVNVDFFRVWPAHGGPMNIQAEESMLPISRYSFVAELSLVS